MSVGFTQGASSSQTLMQHAGQKRKRGGDRATDNATQAVALNQVASTASSLRRTSSSVATLKAAAAKANLGHSASASASASSSAAAPLRRTPSSLKELQAKATKASLGQIASASSSGSASSAGASPYLARAKAATGKVSLSQMALTSPSASASSSKGTSSFHRPLPQKLVHIPLGKTSMSTSSATAATPFSSSSKATGSGGEASASVSANQLVRVPSRVLMPPPAPRLPTLKTKAITFSEEISLLLLSFLDPSSLEMMCHFEGWEKYADDKTLWDAFDAATLFPRLSIFDTAWWVKNFDLSAHGLTFGEFAPLDKRTEFPALTRLYEAVEMGLGVTILTVPAGLTFEKLKIFTQRPKLGKSPPWRDFDEDTTKGIEPIPTSYRVMLSNALIANSRSLSFGKQSSLVEKLGCTPPLTLETSLLIALTYVHNSVYLYCSSGGNYSYTRCEGEQHQVSGQGSQEGIVIEEENPFGNGPNVGMGARKKID